MRTSRIPIVMLTARARNSGPSWPRTFAFRQLLAKPFNPRGCWPFDRAFSGNCRTGEDRAGDETRQDHAFADIHQLDVLARRLENAEGAEITDRRDSMLLVLVRRPGRSNDSDRLLDLTQGRAAAVPFERSIGILVAGSGVDRGGSHHPRSSDGPLGGYLFAAEVEST